MEIFKYVTSAHYEHIKSAGSLEPRPTDGFIYGLPEDRNVWEPKHTKEILKHLQKYSGVSPVVLLRFIVENSDPNALVQEGDEDVWFKMDTRRPLKDYQRSNFRLPEVVITRPIPFEAISIVDSVPIE
ncbi:MAG: hypothetical protein Q7K55_06760 [Candidatus Levybacteria bacterium]|nr:hypothetical protein [Candidatus Levybacteria bacterium]